MGASHSVEEAELGVRLLNGRSLICIEFVIFLVAIVFFGLGFMLIFGCHDFWWSERCDDYREDVKRGDGRILLSWEL